MSGVNNSSADQNQKIQLDLRMTPCGLGGFSDKCEWREMWDRDSAETDDNGASQRDVDPNSLNQRNAAAAAELYSALAPNDMRLIRIHAGTGRINCSVMVGPENGAPSYGALSYVWGPQHDPETILLNSREYLVTQNLFQILTKIRDWDPNDHIFWIDALVINQSDLKERAIEVTTKMRHRYSRAESTVAWIGDLDSVPLSRISSCGGLDIGLPALPKRSTDTLNEAEKEKYEKKTWLVQIILSAEYFKRAWVVQELMYSDEVIMHFDTFALNMNDFLRLAEFNDFYCEAYIDRTSVVGDRRLAIRPGFGRGERYLTVPVWLGCYGRYRFCTNPRDSLFAYYGCLSPEARAQITVDYNRPAHMMCYDITFAWFVSENNLDFLLQVGCREKWWHVNHTKKRNAPSWLLNYFGRELNCGRTVYATPSTQPHIQPLPNRFPPAGFVYENEHNTIRVKGIPLGTIESVGQEPAWLRRPIESLEPFNSFLVEQVMKCEGRLRELDRAVRDLIMIHYSGQKEMVQEHPIIQETLNLEVKAVIEEEKTVEEANERTLRLGEGITSLRTAFALKLSEASRKIKENKIDIPFGVGIPGVEPGDKVFTIIGCSMALVLRPFKSYYVVIGKAWMFGFRDGISLQNNPELVPEDVVEDIVLR